ncbi:MAG: hypothetical protein KGR42_05480 [Acidobacteria bacterium]|nr:hypothetical protein [Acidobacteriota bacterium]
MSDPSDVLEEMAALEATDLLAHHLATLLRWCAVHLAVSPPDLAGARLILDCADATVAAGGSRLGPHFPLYVEALKEARQALERAESR